uniref:SWI/SNF complex component SNF12 homolog n=1 Tax=Erigeron canadensis TaxID=72917 RepID=UPI001CB919A4|nr:SWI/SNF complex component SNF12 homolog [Erigeron canadensis]
MSVNHSNNAQKISGVPSNPNVQFGSQPQFGGAHVQAQLKVQAKAAAQAQANHAQFQAQLQAQGVAINQSQGSLVTTNSGGAKRAGQKPVGRPPGVVNSSPKRGTEVTPPGRQRKKQKVAGKQLQERMAAILPQSALYTELLEFESRVDSALMRKKVDIQEAIKNPLSVQKTLRIYVFNTFANQVQTIPRKANDEAPSWTMKIVGRVLEDGMDPDQAGLMLKSNPMYPKFSSFFKRVTIGLDQRLYPDNHMIVWDSSRMPTPHEGFEVKRKGDKEFNVNIRMEMNYLPEKFRVSAPLMEVLGVEVDTRARVIAAIWQYVKARKLQDSDDPSYFKCDPPLQKVFGEEKIKFSMVSQKISNHLSPPPPIHLEHKIKVSGDCPAGSACYDILVDVPLLVEKELNALLANIEKTKEIEVCDEAICTAIRKINEHHKRRAFFLGFSESPVEFIDALIESQGRDLKFLTGNAIRNDEKESQTEFYNQPWVEDAVIRYLNRRPARIAPKST